MPLLPAYDQAEFDIRKLTEYDLSSDHVVGMHKAAAFRKVLGIGLADAEWLREQILERIGIDEATESESSAFGRRFIVDCRIAKGQRQSISVPLGS